MKRITTTTTTTTLAACPYCQSPDTGLAPKLCWPRGYVWFWRCYTCGSRDEAVHGQRWSRTAVAS